LTGFSSYHKSNPFQRRQLGDNYSHRSFFSIQSNTDEFLGVNRIMIKFCEFIETE